MASGERKETRETLSALAKEELVARAEALGIDGARKFTKVELVDEITRAAGPADRGLLGKARDLLRDVVERGLSRAVKPSEPPTSAEAAKPDLPEPPLATVTLAEIYRGQGHPARAKAIVDEILRHDPSDEAARAMLEKLENVRAKPLQKEQVRAEGPATQPAETTAHTVPATEGLFPDDPYAAIGIEREAFEEPAAPAASVVPAMLDDAPFPARYDVDECIAMAVDPTTIYVYWETRKASIDRAQRVIKGDAKKSTLRVLVVEPTEKGPHVTTRDFDVIDLEYGEWFVRDLPAGSIVRAAIGIRTGERFLPIAHTLDVEAPWASPSKTVARDVVIWSEDGTRDRIGPSMALRPLSRETGMLGLPPLALPPESAEEDLPLGRGLSSAELAHRKRIQAAQAALAAGPSSASFLGKT